jgi:hypothetical protein
VAHIDFMPWVCVWRKPTVFRNIISCNVSMLRSMFLTCKSSFQSMFLTWYLHTCSASLNACSGYLNTCSCSVGTIRCQPCLKVREASRCLLAADSWHQKALPSPARRMPRGAPKAHLGLAPRARPPLARRARGSPQKVHQHQAPKAGHWLVVALCKRRVGSLAAQLFRQS